MARAAAIEPANSFSWLTPPQNCWIRLPLLYPIFYRKGTPKQNFTEILQIGNSRPQDMKKPALEEEAGLIMFWKKPLRV